jgi:histidine triad (HIT) family protein
MPTIFSDIISGKLPAKIVYESDNVIAIEDKYPQAPVHILIMPKKEYKNLQSLPESEMGILTEIVKCAQELAVKYKCADEYRLLTNNGSLAGQTINHLHFHLIGGRKLGTMA